MPLYFRIPGEEKLRSSDSSLDDESVGKVLMAMTFKAPSKLRRKLKLPARATIADAIGSLAHVDTRALSRVSEGIYDQSVYEEDLGLDPKTAKAAVARNECAWQDPAPLLLALEAAARVLEDATITEDLFGEYGYPEDVLPAIQDMLSRVQHAISKSAKHVCMEWNASEL